MGKGMSKTKRPAQRAPLVVRTTATQATQLARVRERRELPTQQQAASTALSAGLRALGLEDAVRLYQNGQSLDEAAHEVGLPASEVFAHFLRERIPLMENEDALNSLARLARRYQLPALDAAVARIRESLIAQPA